ncbi:MAG: molybdopterin molybdotransferase MoeA [Nitrosomonadales bacterium]|nr:molybdopterin molybdotransferase MoeA [Nitrosomonadales bacterium]
MADLTVAAAQRCVIEAMKRSGTESVPLQQALGRVLAADIKANRDQPPYDLSAMDGYALRSADVVSAPVVLEIIEDIKAGDMPGKTVQAGQCARIMTGAPVPQGADAVIRVEDTQAVADGGPLLDPLPQAGEEAIEKSNLRNWVRINVAVKPRNDIRDRGENMRTGEVVLTAGTTITPGVVGMLAMVKAVSVEVWRLPRVAILSTGDELEGLDEPFDANKIPDANSYALMAQVQALGIQPVLLGIARDEPQHLNEMLQRGLQFDVLLVSGGTSVGVHDYVRPTLEALGVQMKFWRVAMKPGHPMAFGVAPLTWVFGLPGNPVSGMVCFEEFVGPALRCIMGHSRLFRSTVTARLTRDVKHRHSRTEFVRVMLGREGGGFMATPTGDQGSGILRSMAMAEGLMVVPAESKGIAAGEQVTVQLLDGTGYLDEAGGAW